MLKISRKKKIILAGLCVFGMNFTAVEIPEVEAVYKSRSDTGTEVFDYIENQRRERRAKELTKEQKKFIEDMEETRQRLPRPISPDEPIPAAFEGDDLTYNTLTGEFTAKGNVDIIQLDGHRFQSSDASGNVNTQDIRVKGKAHVLQLNENSPRVTLDGYNTFYNYGTKTGTMENVKGKAGDYYISGKRFEFYPDHIVAYDAYQTKCGAKHPDYKVSAKRMEIWPEQIIRMYDIQLWIGEVVVGTKKYDERKLESNAEPYFPRAGYNSTNGFYVEDTFIFPVFNEHFQALINAHIDTKNHVRSSAEFHYNNQDFSAKTLYGYYYDGDGRWIKKEPGLDLYYGKHFKTLPLRYHFEYEVGRWSENKISSTHEEYVAGLDHDTIILFNHYKLNLSTSYKITKDDVKSPWRGKQSVRGLNYGIKIFREFDDRFAAFVAYDYTKNTSQNSLYDFDTDSYSNKFSTGVSYRLTDKDRFVVGLKFDTERGTLQDVDYYWYRDLHCSTAILRWRAKRDELEARWQFTPW
ncbi:MAG: LPS-assembly protein LptD [Selenomonadaceae bacterium]|nr:LPS-assembly protein LptD [Selenomonadaceae bacterium]